MRRELERILATSGLSKNTYEIVVEEPCLIAAVRHWLCTSCRTPARSVSPSADGRYDLLTLGETLLRLSPPGQQRLDQARLFEIGVGGSELNVGCLLARLGRRVAWVSRLPEGPLGRIVDGEARRHGVDTRWVRWIENARLGLMFYEPGPLPRTSRVIYDRKHSAAAELGFEDAPWESLVQSSAWLHLSGITPALGPSCRALGPASRRALPRPPASRSPTI